MLSNFCLIDYLCDKFQVRILPYNDEKYLESLRIKYNKTHSLFRVRDEIVALWVSGDDISEGTVREVSASDSEIVDRATRHLLFRVFVQKLTGRKPLSFHPLQIHSQRDEHDAALSFMPEVLKKQLQYLMLTEIHLRSVNLNKKRKNGVAVNVKMRWKLNKSLDQLINDGFDVVGYPVVFKQARAGSSDVLEPEEIALGTIKSVDSERCIVETYEGPEEHNLVDLSLRKSRNEVVDLLSHYTSSSKAEQLIRSVYSSGNKRKNAKDYFSEIKTISDYISQWDYATEAGFKFKINRSSNLNLPSINLNQTKFVFDVTPGAASNSAIGGLNRHGPFDSARFTPQVPKFLVVCRSSNRGGYSNLMGNLEKGIPSSTWFQKGLVSNFRIHGIEWDFVEIGEYIADDVCAAVLQKLSSKKFDLVIFEGKEHDVRLDISENPYWRVKSLCLGNGIPVQGILPDRTRIPLDQQESILSPLALQIYAKIGGTPWAIQCSRDVDHELIIGIGHYLERDTEYRGGEAKRHVGVTTFFSSEGAFLLNTKCQAVPYDDYLDELLGSLRKSIQQISEIYSWDNNSTVRLIFHVFKPLRNDEAQVIDALVKEFPSFDIRYAFVTVSNNQPLIFFNDVDREENSKGFWVPQRMSNRIISPFESLIQLKGKKEIRSKQHGFSNPSLIRIHSSSTFQDIHHITQQVFDFTYLSWRSISPMNTPATIFYSDLIAENLRKLSMIPDWNPNVVNVQLKRKKWFL